MNRLHNEPSVVSDLSVTIYSSWGTVPADTFNSRAYFSRIWTTDLFRSHGPHGFYHFSLFVRKFHQSQGFLIFLKNSPFFLKYKSYVYTAHRSVGCPIHWSVKGQVGWDFEHPGLAKGVPANGRGVGTKLSWTPLPNQTILCFYDTTIKALQNLTADDLFFLSPNNWQSVGRRKTVADYAGVLNKH